MHKFALVLLSEEDLVCMLKMASQMLPVPVYLYSCSLCWLAADPAAQVSWQPDRLAVRLAGCFALM